MNTKLKTPFTTFFENYPEFTEATKQAFLYIERRNIESAYYLGKLQHDSNKSEEEFFNDFYEN